jgi:hypothetical protein
VVSVCMRSLASACHSARQKSRDIKVLLCGSGRSLSKTGIAHYNMSSVLSLYHKLLSHMPAGGLRSFVPPVFSFLTHSHWSDV